MKNGGSAFPEIETDMYFSRESETYYPHTYSFGGMSLRDYFAAHAPSKPDWYAKSEAAGEAAWRYHYADAMIAQRDLERTAAGDSNSTSTKERS